MNIIYIMFPVVLFCNCSSSNPVMTATNPATGITETMIAEPQENGGMIFYMSAEQWDKLLEDNQTIQTNE